MENQYTGIQEIQYMIYLIPVIIGCQLSIYFYYQFFKTANTRLKLNRIFLSYGTFMLIIINGSLLLVLARIFDFESTNPQVFNMLYSAGFALVCASPISYMGFIAINDFKSFMNIRAVRVLIIASIIPVTLVLVAGWESRIFRFSLVITALNAIYMIQFQVQLVRLSMGSIKRRFIGILIGELMDLFALVFAANASMRFIPFHPEPEISSIISFLIGVSILISGLVILFMSGLNFPPFYEVEWRYNLQRLVIIDKGNNMVLYTREFSESSKQVKDERSTARADLYSGGLTGIDEIISTVTGTTDSNIKVIDHGDSHIVLEHGGSLDLPILYCMVVSKYLESFHLILAKVRKQFEAFYREIFEHMNEFDLEEEKQRIFSSFDLVVDHLGE
ncbi:hypothetical protein GF325_16685 [Candidatus Bathyarchaeota archaeon]|nr:hypothetical protein [Candidatus Bathyarchaeota archaeon]